MVRFIARRSGKAGSLNCAIDLEEAFPASYLQMWLFGKMTQFRLFPFFYALCFYAGNRQKQEAKNIRMDCPVN